MLYDCHVTVLHRLQSLLGQQGIKDGSLSLNENAKRSGKRGVNWKGSEVRALLAVWEEEVNRRGAKDSCMKNAASEIFEAIAQKLRMEHDVNKTGVQVQLKCKKR